MTTIAFDGVCFGDGPMTGVARCFHSALRAYASDQPVDCVLLVPAGASLEPIPEVRIVEAPRGTIARQNKLPGLLRSLQAELLHSSVASVPLRAPCATIATAHDLPWLHPELAEPQRLLQPLAVRRFLRAAACIITPSSMTTDDVRHLLGRRCPPVHTVANGSRGSAPPTQAGTDARTGPFLALGDRRVRKNLERLQRAHRRARAQVPDLPELDLVGPPDRYIGETEKNARLADCRALVHVSRFEGFGMPVLEGLAHGAPVVCSDLPPHREIAGKHALFVDPRSVAAMAAALTRIHRDTDLRWRLAEGGHERAQGLTPERAAARWAELHHVLRQGQPVGNRA